MKIFLKNLLLLIVSILLAIFFAYFVGHLFNKIFPPKGEWFWGPTGSTQDFLVGILPAYLFFLVFLFLIFGKVKKWIWILVFGFPVLFFFISSDKYYSHLLFHLSFPLAGWLIGIGARKALDRQAVDSH